MLKLNLGDLPCIICIALIQIQLLLKLNEYAVVLYNVVVPIQIQLLLKLNDVREGELKSFNRYSNTTLVKVKC